MSTFSDAGEIVTGGLLAYAVEPTHGQGAEAGHGDACLNCGAALTGAYCSSCGQSAHVHRTFGAIWHELLHGVLHLDGKLWRTLPELALRPGELTRRYIHGERAKFISPLALFLFSALLMYAAYSIFGHHGRQASLANAQESAQEIRNETAKLDSRIADYQAELKQPQITPSRRVKVEQKLADAQEDRQALAAAGAIAGKVGASAKAREGQSTFEQLKTDREFVAYRLKANAYKFSWALILISTPMVWLLFAWRREYGLYDHATFVTYSIAFMSLLFSIWIVVSGLNLVTSGVVMLALMLYGLWHMYAQMKGAYQLSRTGALLRLPLLYGIAAVSAGMFYAFLTMMT